MRLQLQDLPNHLKRGLSSLYFIFGEEPFQQQEALTLLRNQAEKQGFCEREQFDMALQFDWDRFANHVNTLGLFSQKRIIECHLVSGKIGKLGSQMLTKLAATPTPDTLFFFHSGKLETNAYKSSWFTALENHGITLFTRSLSEQAFSTWLKNRIHQANLSLTEEAFDALKERTEGNCGAAQQVIEKLSLFPESLIELHSIQDLIGNTTRFSLFDLVDAVLLGSLPRTKQIFYSLKNEGVEPILILWALTRELRAIIPIVRSISKGMSLSQGLREHRVLKHKERSVSAFLQRHPSLTFLHQLLTQAKFLDDIIKGIQIGEIWNELFCLCLRLAAPQLETQTLAQTSGGVLYGRL